jgi:hypothetical protein
MVYLGCLKATIFFKTSDDRQYDISAKGFSLETGKIVLLALQWL